MSFKNENLMTPQLKQVCRQQSVDATTYDTNLHDGQMPWFLPSTIEWPAVAPPQTSDR